MRERLWELGGQINKVELFEFEGGNTEMVATQNITVGELLAYIPRQMFITFADSQMSPNV